MTIKPREFPPYIVVYESTAKLIVPLYLDGDKIEIDFDLKKPTAHRLVTELVKFLNPVV